MSGRRYNRSTTYCYKKHVQLRGRRWFYRRSVPPDLRARLGRGGIVRALGTESLTEAEGLAAALDQRVSYVFRMTRRDAQIDAEALIERLCSRYLRQLVAEDRASRRSGHEYGDIDAGLSDTAERLADDLERRRFDAVQDDAEALLQAEGAELSGAALEGLLHELLRTYVVVIKQIRSERERDEQFEPREPLGVPPDVPDGGPEVSGKTLGEAIDFYVQDRETSGHWTSVRAAGDRKRELQLLRELVGGAVCIASVSMEAVSVTATSFRLEAVSD